MRTPYHTRTVPRRGMLWLCQVWGNYRVALRAWGIVKGCLRPFNVQKAARKGRGQFAVLFSHNLAVDLLG